MMKVLLSPARTGILSAVCAAMLAACGGGGDSGGSGGGPVSSITLSGYVAKASVLSGATVTAKCSTGTGTATSGSDGKYTIVVSPGSLPCVLKATDGSTYTYHSVEFGTSPTGNFTANVTLLTELAVAKLGGQQPAAYYTAFGASSSVTRADVDTAAAYLQDALTLALSTDTLLTLPYGPNSQLEIKTNTLLGRMANKGVTLDQLTAAIVANPNSPATVAALLN